MPVGGPSLSPVVGKRVKIHRIERISLTRHFKFGKLANIFPGSSAKFARQSWREAACKLGVTHGNRQKQDKYLVWIAEEEMEL